MSNLFRQHEKSGENLVGKISERGHSRVLGKLGLYGAMVVTSLSLGQTVTAQPTVIATVTVGDTPNGVAVNPVTNQVYVVNVESGGSLSVIDGAPGSPTEHTVIATVNVASKPFDVAVNPSINRIYVTHYFLHSITVYNGASNTLIATVPLGATNPTDVGVNPNTNRIYVTSFADTTQGGFVQGVSVIDGTPGSPTEHTVIVPFIPVGDSPGSVGVNPETNRIYVANQGGSGFPVGNTVSVIDGNTDAVIATVTVGVAPISVGVNPNSNRIYVANSADDTVSVIDGTPGSPTEHTVIATVPVGDAPTAVGVNPDSNRIYVANASDRTLSIINGVNNTVVATVPLGGTTGIVGADDGVGVNPTTSRIYVSHQQERFVSVTEDLPASVPGDLDGDSDVDMDDLGIVINCFGQFVADNPDCAIADVAPPPDGDGVINILDISFVGSNFTP